MKSDKRLDGLVEYMTTVNISMPIELVLQKEMVEIKLKEAQKKIQHAMNQNGQYSHNIISLVLSGLKDYDMANKLIEEFDLDRVYGIQKVIRKK